MRSAWVLFMLLGGALVVHGLACDDGGPENDGPDPAEVCPGVYATTRPSAGQNDGFESGGQSRNFWLTLPDGSHSGPRPLLVAFNGTGHNGQEFTESARLQDFADRGFIVVAPSSADNGTIFPVWDAMREEADMGDPNLDLDYFDQLVQCMDAHFFVDNDRIYIAGHSAGGIFVNYVIQRRSEMLAGAIAASSVHSFTAPPGAGDMADTFVLVTWGGDNDAFSGSAADGTEVPEINFVEQASLTSQFYDAQPNVGQANCHGDDIGHEWLDMINGWMADLLLAHPKGQSGSDGVELQPVPEGTGVSCTTRPFVFVNPVVSECGTSETAGCFETCQLIADCAVENATVAPALGPQLTSLGFSGEDMADCSGCLTLCEETATTEADATVLTCMVGQQAAAECGPGIEGALPFINAVNTCCDGRSDSPYCMEICEVVLTNDIAAGLFTTCQALYPD